MNYVKPHTIEYPYASARKTNRDQASRPRGRCTHDQDEQRAADEVERVSPEGRPAHARTGIRLGVTAALLELATMGLLALVVGIAFSWSAAVLVFGLGTVLGILANPIFWTVLARTSDRDHLPPSCDV
ncbi:MAG: hypothetical protein DHS20C14_00330 [Phycisphaeraceae bacterium]|nr:MAG: hypothetical protein DHS20C14_00330 [Phycisphaeraceae bacterium]